MRPNILMTWLVVGGIAAGSPGMAAAQGQATGGTALTAQSNDQASSQAIKSEIERLRQEFQALRQQYESRFASLEARLATIEATKRDGQPVAPSQPPAAPAAAAPPPEAAPLQAAPPVAQVPGGAAGAEGPTGSPPVGGNTSAMSKIFNPDIAVIGDVLGAAGTNPVAPGPALEMHEAEVTYQAVVDPYARGDFFFTFGPEGVGIEEAYVSLTSLPGGLLTRVGQMRSAFGKAGAMHNHVMPWTDRPLVITNLVGGEDGINDAGISVARLIPNPWVFLEATGQVFHGDNNVFKTYTRSDLAYVAHLRGYHDFSESSNIDLGASIAYGHNDAGASFTTRLFGVDATVRYRPLRRAIYRQFVGRAEFVWSRRGDPGGDLYAFGFYASGDYQFARRWFAGLRYDYAGRATAPWLKDKGASVLLTFWPSEFSQVRGQVRRTRYAEGLTANEFLFQFLFSIGAHGAHPF